MKLTMFILLDGLHLYFNFGKIRFIHDGFITKKDFGTKNLEKCFWPLAQKLGIGLKIVCGKNCTDVLYLHAKFGGDR